MPSVESFLARELTLINAAAVLVVVGAAPAWKDGLRQAEESVASGSATGALERLVAAGQAWHDPEPVAS